MTDELDAATTDQDVIKIVDIGFIRVTTNTQDIHLDFDVTVTDADGDSFSQQLSINPVADALTTFASTSDLADSSFESLSLLSANDNVEQQRSVNNTMIMSAALAAAGLATEPLAARARDHDRGGSEEDRGAGANDEASPTVDARIDSNSQSGDLLAASAANEADSDLSEASSSNQEAAAEDKGVSNENAPPPAVSELSQGTDAPTQSEAQTSQPVMADAVAMISAEQLEAASKEGGKSAEGKDAKPDVGKVLADALNGGENGKDLDALINAVSGQDNAHNGLASHGGNAVSNGDMSVFAGLAAAHSDDIMTQLTMHQDAAPAQA